MAMLVPTAEDGSLRPIDREAVQDRLAQLGGVRRVAYGGMLPLSGSIGARRRMETPGQEPRDVYQSYAGPGFFSILGARILAGRDLLATDQQGVLVNLTLARLLDSSGAVAGRQIRVDGTIVQIVGVFQDTPWSSLGETPGPRMVGLSPPRSGGEATFLMEVSSDPRGYLPQLRGELMAVQPGSTVLFSKTLRQHYDDSLFLERGATKMLYGLGLLAILLTATGLHGITTALFVRRSKEFAIRLAVGAAPRQIMRTVISSGVTLAVAGVALGLVLAMPGALVLRAKVHGFVPWSFATLGLSSAIVLSVAIAAALQPALRVLRIQAADALRTD